MVPIQIILLLVLVGLPESLAPRAMPQTAGTAWLLVLSCLASYLGLILVIAVRARSAVRAMHQPSTSASAIAWKMDLLVGQARWATVLVTAGFLFASPLPTMVKQWLDSTSFLRHVPLLTEMIFLSPALLSWIAFWTASYSVEAAMRDRGIPYRLAQGLPTHEMPSLSQFLSMQCRHNFYIFVPVIVHTVILSLGQFLERWIPNAQAVAMPVGVVIVLLMVPWLLVRIWSTVPLQGALRARLDGVAHAYRLRFRNILLWKTHNGVTNAAILGWVPFARYFLMTDALLESLTDPQIESVFAHEVGHGVHRHIIWYLVGFVGAMCLAAGASMIWGAVMPDSLAVFAQNADSTKAIVSTLLLGLLLALGFPLISHRFEHQADWFACRHMARAFETKSPDKIAQLFSAAIAAPPLLPLELQRVLTTFPTPAETISVEQYMAGHYPHAAEPPAIALPAALRALPDPPPPKAHAVLMPAPRPPTLTTTQAGAEVFISSLDTIIEVAHKARDRRGWMHPSINRRIALLRDLAAHPLAATHFDKAMVRTRFWLVTFVIAGVLAVVGGTCLEIHKTASASAPAPAPAPR